MFTNKAWISNNHKKIKNPVKLTNTTNKFQGLLPPNYDFKFQIINYEKISQSLEPFGIHPTEIYSAERSGKITFVMCFNNPDLLWQKYEGESYGSGQNYIYWKSHKINTTSWVMLDQNDIQQIFNDVDPDVIINQKIIHPQLFE
jgi:hypothetical protein